MRPPIKLIVGLGNPGPAYASTRHNAGEWFLSRFAKCSHVSFLHEKKFKADVAVAHFGMHDCYLLRPTTFMNLSGEAVLACAHFYKISPEAILVAHDELDFPPGTIKFKEGGGHGGHNGLRSIIDSLGSSHFLRLRIGIGHPGHRDLVTPYVLGKPPMDQYEAILSSIDAAIPQVEERLA